MTSVTVTIREEPYLVGESDGQAALRTLRFCKINLGLVLGCVSRLYKLGTNNTVINLGS